MNWKPSEGFPPGNNVAVCLYLPRLMLLVAEKVPAAVRELRQRPTLTAHTLG